MCGGEGWCSPSAYILPVETRGNPMELCGSGQGPSGFLTGSPICPRAQMRQADHAAGALVHLLTLAF